MLHRAGATLVVFAVSACLLEAGELHLKTRSIVTEAESPQFRHFSATKAPGRRLTAARSHWLIEIPGAVEESLAELTRRGATVLTQIPANGFIVAAPEGMDWSNLPLSYRDWIQAEDKISPLLREEGIWASTSKEGQDAIAADTETPKPALALVLVRFHSDVETWQADAILEAEGISNLPHASLESTDRLLELSNEALERLSLWDEVEYVFPAPSGMKAGDAFLVCGGVHIGEMAVSMLAATFGDGWDGPGRGTAALRYSFGSMPVGLDSARVQEEARRALREWSRVAALRFEEGTARQASRNIDILFATGEHGDPFPFLPGTRTLGHSFYPAPPNPEPLAGDIHVNSAYAWSLGGTWDVYSVLLHEAGHSLGLGHTDSPSSVMYPYYQKAESLTPEDIASIRQLYADNGSGTAPASLLLSINSPQEGFVSSLGSVNLSGTLQNATTGAVVNYRNESSGAQGACLLNSLASTWSCAAVPLRSGDNSILVQANSANGSAWARRNIRREAEQEVSLLIQSPSGSAPQTSAASIIVSGNAQHPSGIANLRWNGPNGSSGLATLSSPNGTNTNWSVLLPLNPGLNEFSFRATARSGQSSSRDLRITRNNSSASPPAQPATDRTAPQMTVQTPIGTFIFTSATRMTFRGSATDNVGVTRVSWRNSAGPQSGEARTNLSNGVLQWSFDVNLLAGYNAIEIRAWDAAGNASAYTTTVRRY